MELFYISTENLTQLINNYHTIEANIVDNETFKPEIHLMVIMARREFYNNPNYIRQYQHKYSWIILKCVLIEY